MQVATANEATKLETAMFNVLQFLFSLVFAWLISVAISDEQFQRRQRQFAMAAFRRIKEIERSVMRAQDYVDQPRAASREELSEAVVAIRVSLEGVQDNVTSSIADWSDVIGDHLGVANEILRLDAMRQQARKDKSGRVDERLSQEVEDVERKLTAISSAAPAEVVAPRRRKAPLSKEAAIARIKDRARRSGEVLTFNGYWEESDSFKATPKNMKVGDAVLVARAITRHRSDILAPFDSNGRTMGVVLNFLSEEGCDYDTWRLALTEILGKSLLLDENAGVMMKVKHIDAPSKAKEGLMQGFELELAIGKPRLVEVSEAKK
jgi:hypothetical protein